MCRLNATMVASSVSVETVDRGSSPGPPVSDRLEFSPLRRCLGFDVSQLAQLLERSLLSLYRRSDGMRGLDASVVP